MRRDEFQSNYNYQFLAERLSVQAKEAASSHRRTNVAKKQAISRAPLHRPTMDKIGHFVNGKFDWICIWMWIERNFNLIPAKLCVRLNITEAY